MKNMKKLRITFYTLILSIISFFAVVPFYITLVMSSHTNAELYKGIVLLPGTALFTNINLVLSRGFVRFYFNSFSVSIIATVVSVLISALAGFAIAKYKFRFRKPMFYFIIATMMIPPQLGLIAYIIQMRLLGINNTLLPVIIPWFADAFGVFWMTQYITSAIPNEVLESVRIDGGSEFQIFRSIVIPYIRPAIITLSMLIFLWSWNSYLLPLVIINKPELYTIPLGLAHLGNEHAENYAAKIAGLTLGVFPVIIIYIFGSKNFISGMTAGAVKS